MTALTAKDLDRVAKLLALAGSTTHDAEAVAAVRMANSLLKSRGASWTAILHPARLPQPVQPPPPREWRNPWVNHCETAWHLLRYAAHILTPWEERFLRSVMGYRRLSDSQRQVLDRIASKAHSAAA